MTKSKAISKVERILRKIKDSNFDETHIDVLFVTIRDLPKATLGIREIGAFVAHGNVREQGLINDIILRNHLFLSFRFGKDHELVNNLKNEYPKYLPELVRLQLKLFNDEDLKKSLNLKGGQVQNARANINKKSAFIIDGDYSRPSEKLGMKELSIINHSLTLFMSGDGIDYENLIDEVATLLKDEIDEDLLYCLQESKKEIFCHLLLLLNQVVFSIRKNVSAKTVINFHDADAVCVDGMYPITMANGSIIEIINPVFSSSYHKSDIFDGEVTREDIDSHNLAFSDDLRKIVTKTH